MRHLGRNGRALCAALIAGSLGACDFITSQDNPNVVNEPTLDQIFIAAQVNAYFAAEDQVSRVAAIWTQQAAGTDRQFSSLDTYTFTETTVDDEFGTAYIGGGLVDLRLAQTQATDGNRIVYRGMLKVLEAYLIGRNASIWGDIPYSEAANLANRTPKLDKQEAVYAAIQTVLDGAIADLNSGTGPGPGALDMSYGGSAAKWRAVAYTLKARYYIHWAEAQRAGGASAAAANIACAGNCITKAQAAAASGISNAGDDWVTVHTESSSESNAWFQFLNDRSGYIAGGAFAVDNLLEARGDPRLEIYYTEDADGEYNGSAPGDNNADASQLNVGPADGTMMATCAETQFIRAEALWYQGQFGPAYDAMMAGVACSAEYHGLAAADIPVGVAAGTTGNALLAEIITQKYLANYLSFETYNDYKRTCLPAITTFGGQEVPRRLYYPQGERVSNPNIPAVGSQVRFNTNDPAGCQAP